MEGTRNICSIVSTLSHSLTFSHLTQTLSYQHVRAHSHLFSLSLSRTHSHYNSAFSPKSVKAWQKMWAELSHFIFATKVHSLSRKVIFIKGRKKLKKKELKTFLLLFFCNQLKYFFVRWKLDLHNYQKDLLPQQIEFLLYDAGLLCLSVLKIKFCEAEQHFIHLG